jgi:hypothetical protein
VHSLGRVDRVGDVGGDLVSARTRSKLSDVSDVLEPRGEMLGAALRLAGGRGLALDRRGGGGYVGWAVYATADFDDGEPEPLQDVTVAEAVDLAREGRELILTATLDAIAVLRLDDGAGQPAGGVVLRQSERLVDELVEAGLPRDTVLSLARRLGRAHVVARNVRGRPARESLARDEAGTMGVEGVGARLRRDLERANLSARALAEFLAGEDASRDDIQRQRGHVTRWLALDAQRGMSAANAGKVAQLLHTDPARYLSARFSERYRLELRLRDLEAKLRQTRDQLARLPAEYDARFESEEQFAVPMREPRWRWSSLPPRLVAAGALVLVAVVGLLILGITEGSQPKRQGASSQPASSVPAPIRRPPARHASPARRTPQPTVPVRLSAIGAWDPYGDGREHDTEASGAEDGNSGTYWPTETYTDGLQKPGVGLLLDAGRAVRLGRLVVTTDTPGYSALIEAGSASAGPFHPISRARTVATTTSFSLHARAERYYLIWIRRLDHVAHVNEVRAFGH